MDLFFCERYNCKMTISSCDKRRKAASKNDSSGINVIYRDAGCQNCKQERLIKEIMEAKNGEFTFQSNIAGNKVTIWGSSEYDFPTQKWIAKIEGLNVVGSGDCSSQAILDVLQKFFE